MGVEQVTLERDASADAYVVDGGPVVADGEACYRVPVTLWERTVEASERAAELPELLDELQRLKSALDGQRANERAEAEAVAVSREGGKEAMGESRSASEGFWYAMLQEERGRVAELSRALESAALENMEAKAAARAAREHGEQLQARLNEIVAAHAERVEAEVATVATEGTEGTEGEEEGRFSHGDTGNTGMEPEDATRGQMLEPMLGDLVELEEWPYFGDERLYVGMRGRVIAIGEEHDLGLVQTDIPCKFQTARAQGQTMWWSRTCVRVVERNVQMGTEGEELQQERDAARQVSEAGDFGAALGLVLKAVEQEVLGAVGKHAKFNSAHEGYAVILEELDELKAEVWKKREARDKGRMQDEALQVAAMAVRFVLDVI